MTAQAQEKNRKTVSGTVSPELFDFIDDYHWKNKKNRSQVIGDALLSWAKSEGFEEPTTGETPADPTDVPGEDSGPQTPEPAEAPARSRRAK